MLFELTEGRLAPAHPPLAHSNFASRVDGKFAYARELRMSSEIKMKMKIKIKRVLEMESAVYYYDWPPLTYPCPSLSPRPAGSNCRFRGGISEMGDGWRVTGDGLRATGNSQPATGMDNRRGAETLRG